MGKSRRKNEREGGGIGRPGRRWADNIKIDLKEME